MKSVFKRLLLLGLSLSVVVLAATQEWEKPESAPETRDSGDADPSPAPQPDPPLAPALSAPLEPTSFKPLAGTTVTFSGTLVRAGTHLALRETAGVLYTLDAAGHAWPLEGADVRITGQLDTTTRLLHVDEIRTMFA